MSSIEAKLDRFNSRMLLFSTAIIAVCDAHSFLTTGTLDTTLFWSNIAVVFGTTLYVWQRREEERKVFERWARRQ